MATCCSGLCRGPSSVHTKRPDNAIHQPLVSGKCPVAVRLFGARSRWPRLRDTVQGCRPSSRASRCWRTVAARTPEPFPGTLKAGHRLGNKYEVQEVLGSGGSAVTYKCKEESSGNEVAVKALSLRSLRGWKQLEMFEREGQVLKGLDHPGIPRYLEYFEEESEQDKGFYLVQELANGKSLADMVGSGWRADEREVARIAAGVLAILEYLGSRRPPVIHRDVKPENIVIEGGQAGGRVLLVDFGGVQAVAATGEDVGSTIVGTYGYMAPEQFRGSAEPASDLYGLGATLLYLLSGRPPSAFPQERLRLQYDHVSMSSRLRLLVGGLLEPLVEDRMTARQALGVLRGDAVPAAPAAWRQQEAQRGSVDVEGGFHSSGAVRRRQQQQRLLQQRQQMLAHQQQQQLRRRWELQRGLQGREQSDLARQYGAELYRGGPYGVDVPLSGPPQEPGWREDGPVSKPAGSRVIVRQQGPRLEVEIAPAGWTGAALSAAAFSIAWNAAVGMWTVASLAGDDLLFGLCSIPFGMAGGQLAWSVAAAAYKGERLEIGLNTWCFQQQLSVPGRGGEADPHPPAKGGVGLREVGGRTQDLGYVSLKLMTIVNGEPQARLILHDGDNNQYLLGEGLKYEELRWLWHVINGHLTQNSQLDVGQGDLLRLLPAALQPAAPAVPPWGPSQGAEPLWGGLSAAQHAQQRGWAEQWHAWGVQQQKWQREIQRQRQQSARAALASYDPMWGGHSVPQQLLEGWEPEQQQQRTTSYAVYLSEGALRRASGALSDALSGVLASQRERAAAKAAAVDRWTREVEGRAGRGDTRAQRRAAMLRWCRDIFK